MTVLLQPEIYKVITDSDSLVAVRNKAVTDSDSLVAARDKAVTDSDTHRVSFEARDL